jgi:hypothetical protein
MIDNVNKRHAAGRNHKDRSYELFNSLLKLDGELGNSSLMDFYLATNDDCENSEYFLYLLDIHFEIEDAKLAREHGILD